MRLLHNLRNNRGSAAILSVVICLCILLIMMAMFTYIQLLTICAGIREAVESAVISAVVGNYDDTYSQLREGYSGGFVYTDAGFTETMDVGNIAGRLDSLLGLRDESGVHSKYIGAQKEYSLSNIRVEFENTEFAQGDAEKNLNGTVYMDVQVPIRFSGRELPPLSFTMMVKAAYTPNF